LIVDFLKNEAKLSGSIQAMMTLQLSHDYSQYTPKQMTGVHIAVYFGLKEVTIAVLKEGLDVDSKDMKGRTLLLFAAEHGHGHDATVKLLEPSSVNANHVDAYSKTPPSIAVKNNHKATVELLLKRSSLSADSKDEYRKAASPQSGTDSEDIRTITILTQCLMAVWNGHKWTDLVLRSGGLDGHLHWYSTLTESKAEAE
jgi:ankyrin repeat protein